MDTEEWRFSVCTPWNPQPEKNEFKSNKQASSSSSSTSTSACSNDQKRQCVVVVVVVVINQHIYMLQGPKKIMCIKKVRCVSSLFKIYTVALYQTILFQSVISYLQLRILRVVVTSTLLGNHSQLNIIGIIQKTAARRGRFVELHRICSSNRILILTLTIFFRNFQSRLRVLGC